MSENTKLKYSNFTIDQGYFYTFDHGLDALVQKTDDGNTAFTYPYDTLMSTEVTSSEFDGVYFWSLENSSPTSRVRRWLIDNYICKLQETITFNSSNYSGHNFDVDAFTVEHYHDTLVSGVAVSGTQITLNTYYDHATISGATLHLGPNSNGEAEDVVVSGTISGTQNVTISPTIYEYAVNDSVNYYTNLWLFNNYNGTSTSTGALYKINAHTGAYIKKYPGGAYKDVTACTFYKVNSFANHGTNDMLCYVKGTNTLFVNVGEEFESKLRYYGSMVMENILSDEVTVITVHDIAMDDQNVYRLQKGDDGSGSQGWTYYSYNLSSLDSFVTSISLGAYPAIIAANTVSTSSVVAIVKDQFLQPIVGRLVYFTEDDPVGSIIGSPQNSDADGEASVTYKSGTSAREVKITARVEQT